MESSLDTGADRRRRALEEFAKQFNIPVDQVSERLATLMASIQGAHTMNEEVRRRIADAISELPPPKKGFAPALKITVSLNKEEADAFAKLKLAIQGKSNSDVFRKVLREATASGLIRGRESDFVLPSIRLKGNAKHLPPSDRFFEVSRVEDLLTAGQSLKVPIIEMPSDTSGETVFAAIDWARDFGFFFRRAKS